jgi:16S rRNA (adenine1518-N6/adenine1519-N6)-dimethyltransferase
VSVVAEEPQSRRVRRVVRTDAGSAGATVDSDRTDGEPAAPSQPSLRRLQQFNVRPDRELGQNFLIDSNILGVIGRAADLTEEDVVLEVGGGLGVLSEYLAQRVAHVHVVELDERLRDALSDATDSHDNLSVHWGDAMQLDIAAFEPSPSKFVANLPYNIAAGLILRTIGCYPAMTRWVAMVQREVGERFAAGPAGGGRAGTDQGAYGVPSVLAQLSCEVRVVRTVSRSVFHPVPNVDSVMLLLVRHDSDEVTHELRELVRQAFAHRRKALAGSLALASGAPDGTRERVRAALVEIGHPADVRAERLSPEDFRALARLLDL